MHIDLDGENAHNIYAAFGQQSSAVEYEEFDDWLTVKATLEGRHVYNADTTLRRSSRVFPCTDRLWDLDKILHG